ncbi:MAG: efflux RND transporter periplasmic adaptor subunit [Synergistaceae bacterium]|nr:efflux RND transporter periplasmic adaptor subunit [Synergistaceae bacterium]
MRAGIKKLIILAFIAAIGYGVYMFFFHKEPTVYGLTTSAITRGDIVSTVTATGELNALNVVTVGTQVSGTIQELYVDFNSVVTKGQALAQIDPANAQQTLRQQEATLAGYEASMQSAQASLKDEERQLARNRELFQRKLIARSTVDTSETNVAMKKAALNEARARVANGKAAVAKAKTDLGYTRISSPVDGVVIDRQVDVGQTVAASYQTPTLFKIARDLTRMQIETKVDEADIGTVKEGQNVTFRVDAFPEDTFNGKVVQVRIAPNKSDNVVTYTVIIHVDNSEFKLKPGMTANVSIETSKAVNVLRIPVAALRFTPPEELLNTISFDRDILTQKKSMNTGTLWPERNGVMMMPVQVELGVSDNRNVELVSENSGRARPVLHENTELVINAQAGVKTGTRTQGGLLGTPRGPGGGRPPR